MCFIDSSEGGETAYHILRYCASIGHRKVIFIDPLHTYTFKKISPVNVFGKYPDESAEKVWDIIQIQFQQKEQSETPVIQQYLPAIVRVLHEAGMTLADAVYFTQPAYIEEREEIFARAKQLKHDVLMLRAAFSNRDVYREYRPTGRRILSAFHPILNLYFGSRKGLDFTRLVADKWVIIVNLYPQKGFGKSPARFLGTAIINEIISAMDALTGNPLQEGWKGRFYLYIDEVGRYANRNLADVLAHKGKTGLYLTLAHQNLSQIEDFYVRDAILNLTATKVVFRLESADDANKIARMLYGGQIQDRESAHYITRLQRQECIVKLPGLDSKTVFVRDVNPPSVDVLPYLEKIYKGYVPVSEVQKEQEQRLRVIKYQTYESPGRSHQTSQKSSKTTSRPVGKSTAPRRAPRSKEPEDVFSRLYEDPPARPTDD